MTDEEAAKLSRIIPSLRLSLGEIADAAPAYAKQFRLHDTDRASRYDLLWHWLRCGPEIVKGPSLTVLHANKMARRNTHHDYLASGGWTSWTLELF